MSRYTGEVRFSFTGDLSRARALASYSRTLLGSLIERDIELGGLDFAYQQRVLDDGTKITMTAQASGLASVEIHSPARDVVTEEWSPADYVVLDWEMYAKESTIAAISAVQPDVPDGGDFVWRALFFDPVTLQEVKEVQRYFRYGDYGEANYGERVFRALHIKRGEVVMNTGRNTVEHPETGERYLTTGIAATNSIHKTAALERRANLLGIDQPLLRYDVSIPGLVTAQSAGFRLYTWPDIEFVALLTHPAVLAYEGLEAPQPDRAAAEPPVGLWYNASDISPDGRVVLLGEQSQFRGDEELVFDTRNPFEDGVAIGQIPGGFPANKLGMAVYDGKGQPLFALGLGPTWFGHSAAAITEKYIAVAHITTQPWLFQYPEEYPPPGPRTLQYLRVFDADTFEMLSEIVTERNNFVMEGLQYNGLTIRGNYLYRTRYERTYIAPDGYLGYLWNDPVIERFILPELKFDKTVVPSWGKFPEASSIVMQESLN